MATITRRKKTVLAWADVKEWVASGQATKMLTVGDEIADTLITGEKVVFVVAGIDVYAEKQVIFSLKECLREGRYMNEKYTNRGGWSECNMRRYLNRDVLEMLSPELRDVITPRTLPTDNGETVDKLWLFSEYEIYGVNVYGNDPGDKHIPYYKIPLKRCKALGKGGSAYLWWPRSPHATNTTSFCIVYSNGTANTNNASGSYGVSAGFCI